MNLRLSEFRKRLDALEDEFEAALSESRRAFRYRLENGKAVFKNEAVAAHRALKKSAALSLANAQLRNLIAAPFIYAIIAPLALLDLLATIYQNVAFRLWRIPLVRRRDYVVHDRHRLAYLNWVRKINCLYCEYANGVLAYASEIASRTEQYWCPIKHAVRMKNPHNRYYDFLDFGDADNLEENFLEMRERLSDRDNATSSNRSG